MGLDCCCSKLKLCLLNSEEVGVCGGVNRGVATSHTAANPDTEKKQTKLQSINLFAGYTQDKIKRAERNGHSCLPAALE